MYYQTVYYTMVWYKTLPVKGQKVGSDKPMVTKENTLSQNRSLFLLLAPTIPFYLEIAQLRQIYSHHLLRQILAVKSQL